MAGNRVTISSARSNGGGNRVTIMRDEPERTWNDPRKKLLYEQAKRKEEEARRREALMNTTGAKTINFLAAVPQATIQTAQEVGEYLGRFGISAGEAIGDVKTGSDAGNAYNKTFFTAEGGLKERMEAGSAAYYQALRPLQEKERPYYETPVGRIGSFQKEAEIRTYDAENAGEFAWGMANPMIETIFAGGDVGAVLKAPIAIKRLSALKALREKNAQQMNMSDELAKIDDVETIAKNVPDSADAQAVAAMDNPNEIKAYLLRQNIIKATEESADIKIPVAQKKIMAANIDDNIKTLSVPLEEVGDSYVTKIVKETLKELDETTTRPQLAKIVNDEMQEIKQSDASDEVKVYFKTTEDENAQALGRTIKDEYAKEVATAKPKIETPPDVGDSFKVTRDDVYLHATTEDGLKAIDTHGFKSSTGDRSKGMTTGKGVWFYDNFKDTHRFSKAEQFGDGGGRIIDAKVTGKIYKLKDKDGGILKASNNKALFKKLKKEGYVGMEGNETVFTKGSGKDSVIKTNATFIFDDTAIQTRKQFANAKKTTKAKPKKSKPTKKTTALEAKEAAVKPPKIDSDVPATKKELNIAKEKITTAQRSQTTETVDSLDDYKALVVEKKGKNVREITDKDISDAKKLYETNKTKGADLDSALTKVNKKISSFDKKPKLSASDKKSASLQRQKKSLEDHIKNIEEKIDGRTRGMKGKSSKQKKESKKLIKTWKNDIKVLEKKLKSVDKEISGVKSKKSFAKASKDMAKKAGKVVKKKSKVIDSKDKTIYKQKRAKTEQKLTVRSLKQNAEKYLPAPQASKFMNRLKSIELDSQKKLRERMADLNKIIEENKVKFAISERKTAVTDGIEMVDEKLKVARTGKSGTAKHQSIPKEFLTEVNIFKANVKAFIKTNDFDNAANALEEYETAVDTVVAIAKTVRKTNQAPVIAVEYMMKRGVPKDSAKKIVKDLGDRLGYRSGDDAFRDALFNGKTYEKEAKVLQKYANKFRETDKLMKEDMAHALMTTVSKAKDLHLLPQRLGVEGIEQLTILRNDVVYNWIERLFGTIAGLKNKSPIVKKIISKIQVLAMKREQRVNIAQIKGDVVHKQWATSMHKSEYDDSMVRISDAMEGSSVKLTKEEIIVKNYIEDYYKYAADWMEANIKDFNRRSFYAHHVIKRGQYKEMIDKHGLTKGTDMFISKYGEQNTDDILGSMHETIGSPQAGFLKARKGVDGYSKDVFDSLSIYTNKFEKMRYIKEADPHLGSLKVIGEEISDVHDGLFLFAETFEKQVKGLHKSSLQRFMNKATGIYYVKSLGVNVPSAAANFLGGSVLNVIENGILNYGRGTAKFAAKPLFWSKIYNNQGLNNGKFTDIGTDPFRSLKGNKISKGLMLNQTLAEQGVRKPQFVGLLTDAEEKAFLKNPDMVLGETRLAEIGDNLERTQGIFSPEHTSAFFSSPVMKLFTPFTRWMTQSAKVQKDALVNIKRGVQANDMGQVGKGLGALARNAAILYTGLKIKENLDKDFADKSTSGKFKRKMANTLIDSTTAVVYIPESMLTAPMIEDVKLIGNTASLLRAGSGIGNDPYGATDMKTIKDIYFAPIGGSWNKYFGDKTYVSQYSQYRKAPASERNQILADLRKEKGQHGVDKLLLYEKYDRAGINNEEFGFSYLGYDDRAKEINKYLRGKSPEEKKKILQRLRSVKILNKTVEKLMKYST